MSKIPIKHAQQTYACSRMQSDTMHAYPAQTQTPAGKCSNWHTRQKEEPVPPPHFQLISCMEIIFKTEQNGGPSLSGRVGLCRAPRAGWHVTVYACLLNKRCWPRWKSAIGHLICPTSVIGSWPNTQHSCPLRVEVLVYSMQKLYTKIYRYLGGGCIWDELLIILGAVYKCLLIFC